MHYYASVLRAAGEAAGRGAAIAGCPGRGVHFSHDDGSRRRDALRTAGRISASRRDGVGRPPAVPPDRDGERHSRHAPHVRRRPHEGRWRRVWRVRRGATGRGDSLPSRPGPRHALRLDPSSNWACPPKQQKRRSRRYPTFTSGWTSMAGSSTAFSNSATNDPRRAADFGRPPRLQRFRDDRCRGGEYSRTVLSGVGTHRRR
jgi:hypothetical protein